jgi:hypothetical protein
VPRTLKDPYGSREVVDSPRSLQRSSNDRGRGDEIVCEGIVQVSLSTYDDQQSIETDTLWGGPNAGGKRT